MISNNISSLIENLLIIVDSGGFSEKISVYNRLYNEYILLNGTTNREGPENRSALLDEITEKYGYSVVNKIRTKVLGMSPLKDGTTSMTSGNTEVKYGYPPKGSLLNILSKRGDSIKEHDEDDFLSSIERMEGMRRKENNVVLGKKTVKKTKSSGILNKMTESGDSEFPQLNGTDLYESGDDLEEEQEEFDLAEDENDVDLDIEVEEENNELEDPDFEDVEFANKQATPIINKWSESITSKNPFANTDDSELSNDQVHFKIASQAMADSLMWGELKEFDKDGLSSERRNLVEAYTKFMTNHINKV